MSQDDPAERTTAEPCPAMPAAHCLGNSSGWDRRHGVAAHRGSAQDAASASPPADDTADTAAADAPDSAVATADACTAAGSAAWVLNSEAPVPAADYSGAGRAQRQRAGTEQPRSPQSERLRAYLEHRFCCVPLAFLGPRRFKNPFVLPSITAPQDRS